MSVNSVTFKKSVTLPSEDGRSKAMVSKWDVNFKAASTLSFSSKKTYHIVIRSKQKESLLRRPSNTTSAYVTSTIPKKSDLSKSSLHLADSNDMESLNDHMGKPICSFNRAETIDLGFSIDQAEFEKVNEISSALIQNLGDFLKAHLETTSSPSSSSSPKAEEKEGAKEVTTEEKDKKKPVKADKKDDPKPSAPSKGWTRPSLSSLCGRVMPFAFGFASTAAVLAIFHLLSSEGNIDLNTL